MKNWLQQYKIIISARHNSGEITAKTLTDYHRLIRFCESHLPRVPLESLTFGDITQALATKAESAPATARRLRINMCHLFLEAQRAGRLPMGHNPALLSRPIAAPVKTERLTLDEWLRIFRCAKYRAPTEFQNAMLLSLVTGQRPGDVSKMRAEDVRDGLLHVRQQKTGSKIAMPLSLRLDAISTSLAEVLELCPQAGYLICDHRGRQVNTWTLSRWFKICREQIGIVPAPGRTPPTFREHRSLAERLYRAQGVDTRTLLGHKYQQMTDAYNDTRGREYRVLKLS